MTQKSNDWFEVSKIEKTKQKHLNAQESLTTSQTEDLDNIAASAISCDTHGDPTNGKDDLEEDDSSQKSNALKDAHSSEEDSQDEDDKSGFKIRKQPKGIINYFKKEDVEGVDRAIGLEKDKQETSEKGGIFTLKASDNWFNFKWLIYCIGCSR